ncbi:MAG TPA: hypothetical protein VF576_01455, partial [Rubricoccaceae bacterium]
ERLRAFARWSVAEGVTTTVFTDAVRRRRVPSRFPRFFSEGEGDAVAAGPRPARTGPGVRGVAQALRAPARARRRRPRLPPGGEPYVGPWLLPVLTRFSAPPPSGHAEPVRRR